MVSPSLKIILLSFCTFSLAIVLSVLLQYTDSDYHFGIFKLFLRMIWHLLKSETGTPCNLR